MISKRVFYFRFSPRGFRWMQTMIFAISEINNRQDLLPNITLGHTIMDSCDHIKTSTKSALIQLNGQEGEDGSFSCFAAGRPAVNVSYFASCSCLSKKKNFPYFMRTITSDAFQIMNMHMHGPQSRKPCSSLESFETLYHYMRDVCFLTLGEEVSFDKNGDPIPSYDLINWQMGQDGSIEFVKVGYYNATLSMETELLINNHNIVAWRVCSEVCESCNPGTRRTHRKGQPTCSFDYIPCADGDFSNQADAVECLKCSLERWSNEAKDQCIIVISIVWLTTSPPYAIQNTKYHCAKIILECSFGSNIGFWCVLGYIGFLASLCFIIAFLARKLPVNFNKAKFIVDVLYFALWISFIPAYVSTSGKYTVAVELFAILASAFGLLVCIFAPKC
ncbi:V2R26 protein, partial [Polypterus senegalus]|nr:V2R26 protein [Polypterus senegalus]